MSLVFLTLGLIILVVSILTRVPGLRAERKDQVQGEPMNEQLLRPKLTVESQVEPSIAPTEIELARVAAIAVALVHSQRPASRPVKEEPAASKWKQYGRSHQLGL
jgi:hypothetical protein